MNDRRVLIRQPSEALRPFVRRFLVVESVAAHADSHLPEPGLVAAFSFRGDCRLGDGAIAPRAAITGLWGSVRRHAHSHDHAVVIASFTATGAAALLRPPLEEFANTTIDLDAVLGQPAGLHRLHEQLSEAANHEKRIGLVESLLIGYVGEFRSDPLIEAAVADIERWGAAMRVEGLARKLGLSQSALERRFRKLVGTTPREFASLVRLQNVVRLRETGADWTTIAHAAGYRPAALHPGFQALHRRGPRSVLRAALGQLTPNSYKSDDAREP